MPGIAGVGAQRGCTVIAVDPDGAFTCRSESFYQEKYRSVDQKEDVSMQYDPAVFDRPGAPEDRTFRKPKAYQ